MLEGLIPGIPGSFIITIFLVLLMIIIITITIVLLFLLLLLLSCIVKRGVHGVLQGLGTVFGCLQGLVVKCGPT